MHLPIHYSLCGRARWFGLRAHTHNVLHCWRRTVKAESRLQLNEVLRILKRQCGKDTVPLFIHENLLFWYQCKIKEEPITISESLLKGYILWLDSHQANNLNLPQTDVKHAIIGFIKKQRRFSTQPTSVKSLCQPLTLLHIRLHFTMHFQMVFKSCTSDWPRYISHY